MSRKRRPFGEQIRAVHDDLVHLLAKEIHEDRESGQPIIDEEEFPSGKIRVRVYWDKWNEIPDEDRVAVILRSYEKAESASYRDRIALAVGLTVPEARTEGLLPFEVVPLCRRDDPVTLEQCRQAMIEDGASILAPNSPQLRFATLDEAEAARRRLGQRLPGSEPVWTVVQDVGSVESWIAH